MTSKTRVFRARRIITMNPSQPFAQFVAVRDGRILAVGGAREMEGLAQAEVDERFADAVLLPGFVEGHCHLFEGTVWRHPYVGYFDRRAPDGQLVTGLRSIAAVVQRLQQAAGGEEQAGQPLPAWGFDPIYMEGRRMTVEDLDAVSTRRPVVITHASGHIMNVNSLALRLAGIDRDTDIDGLVRDATGEPTGELLGFQLMERIRYKVLHEQGGRMVDLDSMQRFALQARRVGVTTATDLVSDASDATVEVYEQATSAEDYPLRVVPAMAVRFFGLDDGARRLQWLRARSTDTLHYGLVKLHVDGSIQGFTARLRWPGYHNGAPNGLWYTAPAELEGIIGTYHRAGAVVHMHTNGDEATEAAVEALERVLTAHPRPDHRHTLQHCQMPDQALFRRIRALGLCCNLFANHVYYWGDAHYAQTMGPSRAQRMDACGTALRMGIPFSIHSDAPITPLDPLFTAWCAVMRQTASGRILGEDERIPVAAALQAITLGAAYTLKLDHLVGSIEVGKFADFAVLASDPLEGDPAALKDVEVLATVRSGNVYAN